MKQIKETYDVFTATMSQHIEDLGLDPKKVDWGDENESLLIKQQRILATVSVEQKKSLKTQQDALIQQGKDIEARLRKELGLDNVDTTTNPAIGGRGKKPTLEELRSTTPEDIEKKVKAGEWKITGWKI